MLFDKLLNKPEEKKAPTLLGEDFDIFPDISDKPAVTAAQPYQANEESEAPAPAQDDTAEVEAPPEPSEFQKKIAAISEKNWLWLQIAFGTLMGALSGVAITFLSDTQTFSSYGLIIAAVLALIVPNFVEKRVERKMVATRIAIIVTILIFMAAYILIRVVFAPPAA